MKAAGEFGHFYSNGPGYCIDAWGAGPFVIEAAGKSWRFDDCDRFGPMLIKRNGDPLANPYPGERSPFWRAHRIWVRQGRRTGADGVLCVWDEPAPTTYRRVGRRTAVIIEHGDEDGAFVEVAEDAPQPSPVSVGGSEPKDPALPSEQQP